MQWMVALLSMVPQWWFREPYKDSDWGGLAWLKNLTNRSEELLVATRLARALSIK